MLIWSLKFVFYLTPSGRLKQNHHEVQTLIFQLPYPLWGTSLRAKCKDKGEVTLARITHYALRIAHYLTPSGELLANAGWGLLPPKNHNYAKKTVALNCATVFCFLLTLYSTVSELLSGRQPLKPLRATPVLHFALIQWVRATPVLNSLQANFTFGFAENITLQRNISHGIAVYHKKVSRS